MPKNKKRLIHYVGSLFSKMLSFVGIITTLMWIGINHYEAYYYFHKALYIYGIIIIGCIFIVQQWSKEMYKKYLKSDSNE